MTPPIEVLLRRVSADLRATGVEFAVVGGLAVAARTEPRFTKDVDVAISVASDEEAEQVIGQLIGAGYRPIAEMDQLIAGRPATLRLVPPDDSGADPEEGRPVVDIICSSSGIEPEVVTSATMTTVFPTLKLPTACIPHLIAMKVLSESDTRLQDRLDLQALIAAATDADLGQVPRLLNLITHRGYGRGKDLHGVLARFCGGGPPRP